MVRAAPRRSGATHRPLPRRRERGQRRLETGSHAKTEIEVRELELKEREVVRERLRLLYGPHELEESRTRDHTYPQRDPGVRPARIPILSAHY